MGEDQAPAPAPASTGPEVYKVKVDHFVGVNVLGEEAALAGAPNFRQVNTSTSGGTRSHHEIQRVFHFL